MHIFIAGVMQGNRLDHEIDDQDYRVRIGDALKGAFPDARITDPWAMNLGSVHYDADRARRTFVDMTVRAGEADLLIAYLPTLSMGTAMEMWQAFQSGTYIIAITPYVHHWAIRFTADEVLPDLESLLDKIRSGELTRMIEAGQG